MRGGIPHLSLPAGYLGSSLIGAALIACGFDERASKVASIVVGVFFLFTLWWARRDWLTWVLILVSFSFHHSLYVVTFELTWPAPHVIAPFQGMAGCEFRRSHLFQRKRAESSLCS